MQVQITWSQFSSQARARDSVNCVSFILVAACAILGYACMLRQCMIENISPSAVLQAMNNYLYISTEICMCMNQGLSAISLATSLYRLLIS